MSRRSLCGIAAAILASASLFAAAPEKSVSTPAGDSRITYIGRTLRNESGVSFDWSGVTAKVSFTGQYIALKASDSQKNWYNVWIDKAPCPEADMVITIAGSDTTIVIADEAWFKERYGRKSPAQHTLVLQKRTEGEQGTTTFKEFITKGEVLQSEGLKSRMIEFVGDSYTCGYGSENSIHTDPFKPETENVNKTYAAVIGRYFDADIITVAHSGMGIARNYNTKVGGWYMHHRYTQTFDKDRESRWDASADAFKPQVSVIYLGTNDFSVSMQPSEKTFTANYITLIKEIKANWGEDHPVICVSSKCDANLFNYVRQAVETCGLSNVHYCGFFEGIHYNDDRDLGASSHPNYTAHKKLASALMPYISTMTGWPLRDEQ